MQYSFSLTDLSTLVIWEENTPKHDLAKTIAKQKWKIKTKVVQLLAMFQTAMTDYGIAIYSFSLGCCS